MTHGNHQQRLNESLSALMDGEAGELEVQRLLKAGEAGVAAEELRTRWSRYQLAASVMRNEQVAQVGSGLAASISAAIADEPAYSEPSAPEAANDASRSRWWRPLSRGAVAATVAFAAVLGVQQMQAPQTDAPAMVAEVERPAQAPVQSVPQLSGFRYPELQTRTVGIAPPMVVAEPRGERRIPVQVAPTPELMRHLNRVMVEHSEQAAQMGAQGMLPYARATYGERPTERAPQAPE